MEFSVEVLKLLFGQVGALGTICIIAAAYMAYLHRTERLDHNLTRDKLFDLGLKTIEQQAKVLTVLEEIQDRLPTSRSVRSTK